MGWSWPRRGPVYTAGYTGTIGNFYKVNQLFQYPTLVSPKVFSSIGTVLSDERPKVGRQIAVSFLEERFAALWLYIYIYLHMTGDM